MYQIISSLKAPKALILFNNFYSFIVPLFIASDLSVTQLCCRALILRLDSDLVQQVACSERFRRTRHHIWLPTRRRKSSNTRWRLWSSATPSLTCRARCVAHWAETVWNWRVHFKHLFPTSARASKRCERVSKRCERMAQYSTRRFHSHFAHRAGMRHEAREYSKNSQKQSKTVLKRAR